MTDMMIVRVVYSVLAFILGSVIGSFLNVVILRTPRHESIVTEPSHCFSCGERLKWYDMFPVFSWLILRGRCRFCGAKISPRYMIIEAICGLAYLAGYLVFGLSITTAYSAVLFAILIVLSGIDIDHFEIPYWCSITIGVMGISAFFVFPEVAWYERLIALGAVGVLFVILVLIGGMGGGDLQLMLGASLLLGYKVFIALFIGVLLGAVYGVIKKARDHKSEVELSKKIEEIVRDWYQKQVDRDVGYVKEGHSDIIVGSISEGEPDIEWEFLDEPAWKGLPDKAALSRALRKDITDEREGGFKIHIKEDIVEKVKYSRRMVFGPFLAAGIASAWLFGNVIFTWYTRILFQ